MWKEIGWKQVKFHFSADVCWNQTWLMSVDINHLGVTKTAKCCTCALFGLENKTYAHTYMQTMFYNNC